MVQTSQRGFISFFSLREEREGSQIPAGYAIWVLILEAHVSSRISEILSVLKLLASTPASDLTLEEVRRQRIQATKEVADDLGITHETVRDALTRQLHPDVHGIRSFDGLVLAWLRDESRTLEHAVQQHTVDSTDAAAVTNFFKRHEARA